MIKTMTTLAISHNIFLTKEQRYSLQEDKELEIVGISVPVWYYNGKTSEPAEEVFVKYKISNKEESIFIKPSSEGYEITIPSYRKQGMPSISDLLDIEDGGVQYAAFSQNNKVNKKGKICNVLHYVEIKDMLELTETLLD